MNAPSLGQKRILIVDDSAAMRALVAATLCELPNCDILEASGGVEALRCLTSQSVDLLVMDINMPDINGLELLAFVRKNAKTEKLPVLVVSTDSTAQDRERCRTLGANAFLGKPFSETELLKTVQSLWPPK